MKKLLIVLALLFAVGCSEWFTGERIETVDANSGVTVTEYKEPALSGLFDILAVAVPGIGTAAAAAFAMAKKGARAKDAIMDANKDAIDAADYSKIDTAESFKALLKAAQEAHPDAKVIKKEYDKWKAKKK